MQAKNVLLTHFSQRYSKFLHIPIDPLCPMRVGFAVDLMQIPLSNFNHLSIINNAAVSRYFGDEEEEIEEELASSNTNELIPYEPMCRNRI